MHRPFDSVPSMDLDVNGLRRVWGGDTAAALLKRGWKAVKLNCCCWIGSESEEHTGIIQVAFGWMDI
jgi:hypothetical protein